MAVCLTGLSGVKAFDAVGDPSTLAQRWGTWKSEFELYVVASGVSDATQQRALLLHLAGPQVRDIFNNSIPTAARGEAKDYKKAMDALTEYFKPQKNVPMARQAFLAAQPRAGETINNFVTRLQMLAEHCEYGDEKDNQVRDRTISHIKDKFLKAKLYREDNLSLAKMLDIVAQYHDKDALVLAAETVQQIRDQTSFTKEKSQKAKGKCWKCAKTGHYAKDCRCSKNHRCEQCGLIGHFAVCCKTKREQSKTGPTERGKGQPQQGKGNASRQDVRQVSDEREEDFYIFCTDPNSNDLLDILIEDKSVNVVVDSGASCNLMCEEVFNYVTGGKASLSDTTKRIFPYASDKPLDLAGKCCLNVCEPKSGNSVVVEFFITQGKAATLLGRASSELLGVLRVGIPVNSCFDQPDKKAALRAQFPDVFKGLGKLKEYKLKLHIDESIIPVAQPVRRIPFSRRAKVEEKLAQLEKLDVIEKVDGPTSWVNPLVVVENSEGGVRLCLDMRQANRAIVREKHPVPTFEEALQEVSKAKVFSKLDLNMAFHQIELDVASRDITTFAAPNGLYRYKRLLFGVNMATEKFQHIIWQTIKDCPGAYNMYDDLRVVGADQREHDENLERVMRKLQSSGLTLNYEKCQIGVDHMTYMGDILSADGLQVSAERVEAIVNAPPPQNKSEVRSFLGSVQFCSKFLDNFATISSPLWELTAKDIAWRWTSKESQAFQEIKDKLTQAPVMAYHQHGAATRLTTDASPVGLGAVLEQEQEDGSYRPIYYASRKLNKVEQRYSQFEREALAVRWACEKFYLYLYGIEFEINTDHKPLLTVLGPNSKPPSARIERWLLYLQQFRYTIKHIPGKSNSADALSRLPVGATDDADTEKTEEFAYSVTSDAVPAALNTKQVELASEKDGTLQLIRQAIITDDWTKLQGTIYKAVKDELWMFGKLVMRENRIVMPESLWETTVKLAHEGHQGMVRTKARLRDKVWWPKMDKKVEKLIRACHPCQLVGPRPKPEPIRSSQLPDRPWQDISIDLLDVPHNNHLLVIIDYYSRWIEAILLKKTDASHVIRPMEALFQTHGLPETVRSDNGPPFTSNEFVAFLDYLAIDHKRGIPYWPSSNGEVERSNETILKIIRIAHLEGRDWKKALEDFLFHYRTTPHTVTGISPAELLMGRQLRDKLPKLQIPKDKCTEAEWQQLLRDRNAKAKLRQKEYADKSRSAEPSEIAEGDKVLLKQARENKLSSMFETEPYKVLEKTGNAVILESAEGVTRMRNVAHMKKFIEPSTSDSEVTKGADLPTEQDTKSSLAETAVEPPNVSQTCSDAHRPARARQPPVWMKDYAS